MSSAQKTAVLPGGGMGDDPQAGTLGISPASPIQASAALCQDGIGEASRSELWMHAWLEGVVPWFPWET